MEITRKMVAFRDHDGVMAWGVFLKDIEMFFMSEDVGSAFPFAIEISLKSGKEATAYCTTAQDASAFSEQIRDALEQLDSAEC